MNSVKRNIIFYSLLILTNLVPLFLIFVISSLRSNEPMKLNTPLFLAITNYLIIRKFKKDLLFVILTFFVNTITLFFYNTINHDQWEYFISDLLFDFFGQLILLISCYMMLMIMKKINLFNWKI
jgi:hypothetical protein